jgi:hypothetical protein
MARWQYDAKSLMRCASGELSEAASTFVGEA